MPTQYQVTCSASTTPEASLEGEADVVRIVRRWPSRLALLISLIVAGAGYFLSGITAVVIGVLVVLLTDRLAARGITAARHKLHFRA